MTNNDVLRRLRYTFDFNDDTMMKLFKVGGYEADRTEISSWLKKEDAEDYQNLPDKKLATFLNGFIVFKRGQKEGAPAMTPENKLNNNLILRKLKIAMAYKTEDLIELLDSVDFKMGKSEINAFFRKPDHPHFRKCKDQVLRNILAGMQQKFRPSAH